jgi:drug/metabolite transporter (DMT)-like permease
MRRGYLALITLALIWGAAFFFIKLAIRDMSPATLVLSRAGLGAATLAIIFAVRRQTPFPTGTRARLLPFLGMAVLGSLIPWAAIAFGEESISSGLASILNATTPLWTAVFAYWVTPAERPSPLNYLGVAIGFLGTGILIAPDLIGQPLRATTIGTLAVAGAAASYAVAALLQRRRLRGVSPIQVGFWQLALTAPLALAVALPHHRRHAPPPPLHRRDGLSGGGRLRLGLPSVLLHDEHPGRHARHHRDLPSSGDGGLLGREPPARGDHHPDPRRHGRDLARGLFDQSPAQT